MMGMVTVQDLVYVTDAQMSRMCPSVLVSTRKIKRKTACFIMAGSL